MPIAIEGKPKLNIEGNLLIVQKDGKVVDVGETISKSADWNSRVKVIITKMGDSDYLGLTEIS